MGKSKKSSSKRKRDSSSEGASDEPHITTTAALAATEKLKIHATRNPGGIKNKQKRSEVYAAYLKEKKRLKKDLRTKKVKEVEALGEDAVVKKSTPKTRTIDNTREIEEAMVHPGDEEVIADEMEDEFSRYFNGEARPKIMITTRPRPSQQLFKFIGDIMSLVPNSFFYPRREFQIKDIIKYASNKKVRCNGKTGNTNLKTPLPADYRHPPASPPAASVRVLTPLNRPKSR